MFLPSATCSSHFSYVWAGGGDASNHGSLAALRFDGITTTEGAPPLRSLQGWAFMPMAAGDFRIMQFSARPAQGASSVVPTLRTSPRACPERRRRGGATVSPDQPPLSTPKWSGTMAEPALPHPRGLHPERRRWPQRARHRLPQLEPSSRPGSVRSVSACSASRTTIRPRC